MAYSAEKSNGFASIQDYFSARAALIDAEQQLGYEGHAKRTELESAAEKVFQNQKTSERDNLYGVNKDGSGCEAGHRFLYCLDLLKKSKIAEFAFKAPKGCLLHCHFDAILPPDGMLSDARKQDHLYIKSDVPLIREGFFEHALPQFTVLKEQVPLTETTNLFQPTYIPGSWMKYSSFLEMFPGGVERAESWLTSLNVIDATDAYHSRQTVDGYGIEICASARNLELTLLGFGRDSSAPSFLAGPCCAMSRRTRHIYEGFSGHLRETGFSMQRFALP